MYVGERKLRKMRKTRKTRKKNVDRLWGIKYEMLKKDIPTGNFRSFVLKNQPWRRRLFCPLAKNCKSALYSQHSLTRKQNRQFWLQNH